MQKAYGANLQAGKFPYVHESFTYSDTVLLHTFVVFNMPVFIKISYSC